MGIISFDHLSYLKDKNIDCVMSSDSCCVAKLRQRLSFPEVWGPSSPNKDEEEVGSVGCPKRVYTRFE